MSLCHSLGLSEATLVMWTVLETHWETPGRTEGMMAHPNPPTWMPGPVLQVGSSEQSGFNQEAL